LGLLRICGCIQRRTWGGGVTHVNQTPHCHGGFWCDAIADKSSNYREFRNLHDTLERLASEGELVGREVFICVDNEVTERIYYKGSSTDGELFELMVHLRRISVKGQFKLHVVHISGKRMIKQGTDGLSRGEVDVERLLSADANEVPIHRFAIDRSPAMHEWVTNLMGDKVNVATPSNWFHEAQQGGSTKRKSKPRIGYGTFPQLRPPMLSRSFLMAE